MNFNLESRKVNLERENVLLGLVTLSDEVNQ